MDSNVEKREPTLNFEAATEWQKYQLGKATYEAVLRFLQQPGGKVFLDKKIQAAREAEVARAVAAAEAAAAEAAAAEAAAEEAAAETAAAELAGQ